jgi:hypothetical protein
MPGIKVYELARELSMPSRDLCMLAQRAGLPISSAARRLSDTEERVLREVVRTASTR